MTEQDYIAIVQNALDTNDWTVAIQASTMHTYRLPDYMNIEIIKRMEVVDGYGRLKTGGQTN